MTHFLPQIPVKFRSSLTAGVNRTLWVVLKSAGPEKPVPFRAGFKKSYREMDSLNTLSPDGFRIPMKLSEGKPAGQ